jgi:hypothetical protein
LIITRHEPATFRSARRAKVERNGSRIDAALYFFVKMRLSRLFSRVEVEARLAP